MRKRNVKFIFDKILWGLIMLLPILLYMIYLCSHRISADSVTILSIEYFLHDTLSFFTGVTMDDIVMSSNVGNVFYEFFESGIFLKMPLTASSFISWYLMYIICVELMHICVDVILLLPRICRNWLDKFKSEE